MKLLKSDYNLALLDNFVLHITHFTRYDCITNKVMAADRPDDYGAAVELYEQIDSYIAEDHVDGVDGDGSNELILLSI